MMKACSRSLVLSQMEMAFVAKHLESIAPRLDQESLGRNI